MTITMFSLPADECRACWSTEKRFKHHSIAVKKVLLNESEEAQKKVAQLGYRSAPVVVVTDETGQITDHWGGYRESKIAGYKA